MTERISIGILGCAKIAEKYILPNLIDLSDVFNVIGIASRDKEKGSHFASKFNVTLFNDYYALLENQNLNAIYIPLPNSLHAEWIRKSLERGLHVLCEKSLGCSLH